MNVRPPRSLVIATLVVAGIALFSCARRLSLRGPSGAAGGLLARGVEAPRIAAGPRIDHAKHLLKGLECVDCHMKGSEDETLTEPQVLSYAVCSDCHDDEDKALAEEKRVKSVFFKADGSPAWETAIQGYEAEVKWSHVAHAKLTCADCHGDPDATPRAVRQPFTMDGCLACHAQKAAPSDCATCHQVLRGDVPPPSHAQGWRRGHGPAALSRQERCEICHRDPATCDRCHQRTPPVSHGPGWLAAHGAASVAGPQRCEMCHADPSACVDCHLVTKPASHDRLWTERHGDVALSLRGRASGRCELCHLDPNFCQRCHATQEPRSHTHLFRTATHGNQAALDRASCQVCHETDFCVRCHEETPPRSHGPMWASGPSLHCAQCHLPISFSGSCRACHFEEPTHSTAPPQPAWHTPGMNCRLCHTPAGNGAPPLRHIDNGTQCEVCHR